MKALLLAAAFLTAIATVTRAEWVIIEKQSAAGQTKESKTQIKGDKARTDVGEDQSVLLDTATSEMIVLMHAQKSFMKMNPETIKGAMAMAQQFLGGATEGGAESGKPVATGEMAKVGDWDAEIYTWKGKIGGGKFWIAKDFEGGDKIQAIQEKLMKGLGAGNPMAGLVPNPADFPGIVVKSEITIMGQTATTELVSAKEEIVPDAVFAMPADYQEMKMPSIPGLGQ